MTPTGLILAAALFAHTPQSPAVPAQALATSTTGTAELRGRVVGGTPATPVAGATVVLSGRIVKKVVTDDAGRFVFTKLPSGTYSISVSGNGFAVTSFGSGAPRAISLDINDGDRIDRGDLVLPSGAEISGVILDERGNPLKGATVSAWRTTYTAPGEPRLSFEGQALSDETGDYRIVGLKPGTYFVDAKANASIAPTFFPASANADMASPVTVTATAGAAGISIRLLSIPLARVSGSIVNSQGLPSANFFVLLAPLRDDGAQVSGVDLTSDVDAAGKFSVGKVPPGNYLVVVVAKSRLEMIARTGQPAHGVDSEAASQPVTVDGRDVDDLSIRTSPPARLSGKVTLDGNAVDADLAKRLTLSLAQNSGPGGMQSVLNMTYATPGPDGAFSMPAIAGGRLLRINGLPSGTALRQVLLHGIDVTDEGFDVGSFDIGDVIVALTSTPSRVTGHVANDQGALVGGASVIVFPAEERHWHLVMTRLVKAVKTDKDGAFSVTALPPGSYFAVAVPVLADGEWAAPSNLERLRVEATAFKLSDGEQKALSLTVKRVQ